MVFEINSIVIVISILKNVDGLSFSLLQLNYLQY